MALFDEALAKRISDLASAFNTTFASLISGKVPAEQLPSYVDDVLEYANLAALPGTGESGKIYITVDTNKTFRWSGSIYVEISASPGSSDSVTEGTINLYFTNARALAAAPAETVTTIKAALGITTLSGSNTGDETLATIKSKLGITTLSGSNTGDQTSVEGLAISGGVIKWKKITGTTASVEGGLTAIAHGLTAENIVGMQSLVHWNGFNSTGSVPGDTTAGYQFYCYYDATNINLKLHDSTSEGILNKPFTVLIQYL
jgi:hypothetical protein